MSALMELAGRVASGAGLDNALDVEIEVALFEPDEKWGSIRPNARGTKVVCTGHDGSVGVFWANEWTGDRLGAVTALRARAQALITGGE